MSRIRVDWQSEGAVIKIDGESYDVQVSPYSLGAKIKAPLIASSSMAELEALDFSNKVLLIRGELTKEQFLPKNFPFFQVDEQQRIIRLLDEKKLPEELFDYIG